MPKNSIFIKEKEIKDLLESLSISLSQHNKINRIYVKSNANKEEYLIADDTVIELINANLSLSRLTEAWIKLLFISSLKRNIKRTKVIFRKENNIRLKFSIKNKLFQLKKYLCLCILFTFKKIVFYL